MDDIMLNVPLPKRLHTDELDPEDNEVFIGMDMFGGNQPPHMNFKDFFKLKLVREKDIKKFQIKQQFYDVEIEKLPFTLSNGLSMQVLPELFSAIFEICTATFTPNDRICIDIASRHLDPNIYLQVTKFSNFNTDLLFRQMEKLNSSKRFAIDDSFKVRQILGHIETNCYICCCKS